MDRLLEPTKDCISFPDLFLHLSSANNESLWDVANYLDCRGLDKLEVWILGMNYEFHLDIGCQETTHYFLEGVMATLTNSCDWVLAESTSFDLLSPDKEDELIKWFNSHNRHYFRKSDLLSFEPLNGLLHFEDIDVKHTVEDESIENPFERPIEENHRKYISVTKYINDLGKGKSIGSGKPLKVILKYLLENISINEINLYKLKKEKYSLIPQTNNFKYKSAAEILLGVYDILDDDQTGTVSSDNEPFKDFYFKYSEVKDLINSGSKTVKKNQLIHNYKQPSTNNTKPSDNSSVITNLGKNQRLLITYALFTADDMVCLIIDENPACISHNDNYLAHHRMVSNAITAKFLITDDEGAIPAEQVKTWLAIHNFIYKGFNDNLRNNATKLVGQPIERTAQDNILIKELESKIEGLSVSLKEERASNKKLSSELKEAITTIEQMKKDQDESRISKDGVANDQLIKFDWYNLDRAVYPPELHLALVLWQQMYQSNKIKNIHHNSHNSRFEVAAKSLGLKPKSSLGGRLNTVTNPVKSKMEQYILAKQLYDIKTLNMPTLLTKKPK